MTQRRRTSYPAPVNAIVRRIMRKHGLSEPSARTLALLALGESALDG